MLTQSSYFRYGHKRSPLPGIPANYEPVTECQYNPSLLSVTNPAVIPLTPATCVPPEENLHGHHAIHLNLLLVNRRVNEELTNHLKISKNRRTSLFVAFPDGLHILKTVSPHLIRQARSIHIAGTYMSRAFRNSRADFLSVRQEPHQCLTQRYGGNYIPDSADQLSALVAASFGPSPTHPIRKLELRIYYPGTESYSTVWGDDSSPTVVALRNICSGEVGIEVWRGRSGTGLFLTARPPKGGEKKRVVSTVWRMLREGERGEPKCGSWVVDPRWPQWEEGDDHGSGVSEGCSVVSRPVGEGE